MTAAATPVVPPQRFGELLAGLPDWARKNLPRTIVASVAAGVMGYVANVWMMAVRYQGTADVPAGAPATSSGNVIGGALFWALGSSVVFGIVGYRQSAGKERFWREARSLPRTLAGLVRRDGTAGQVHLLWGAAVALVAGLVVPPALGAVMAVAVLAAAPTVLGSIISSTIFRLWQSAARPLGPSAPRPVGIESMLVGLIGGGLALTAGMLIADATIRLVLALAAAALAIVVGKQVRPPGAVVVVLVLVAATVAVEWMFAAKAVADDGAFLECNGSWSEWLKQCSGSAAVRRDSIAGGIASAVGAPVGGFVGGLVGSFPPVDDGEPLLDPVTGQPVPVDSEGWVNYHGQWMTAEEAAARIAADSSVAWGPDGRPVIDPTTGQPLALDEDGLVDFDGERLTPAEAAARIAASNPFAVGSDGAPLIDPATGQALQLDEDGFVELDGERMKPAEAEARIRANSGVAFGPDGRPVIDPATGQPLLLDEDGLVDFDGERMTPADAAARIAAERQAAVGIDGSPLVDPMTGQPLPLGDDGLVDYHGERMTPDEAATRIAADTRLAVGPDGAPLVDPATGQPLPVGRDGLVDYHGERMTAAEAARRIVADRQVPEAPVVAPVPGFHPLVDPGSGDPMIYFDPALHGGGGKPGQVWWGGTWRDPNSAEFAKSFQDNIDLVEELRAGHEMFEAFHERNQVFEQQRRDQIRAEQAAQTAQNERQQQAIKDYGELIDKVGDLPANERYTRVLESLDNHLYREDGTIDPAAVNRARGALFRLVATDQALPDSELRPNSVLQDLGNTALYTAGQAAPILARAGLAYVTAGVSEVGIQSYGMTTAMMQSDTPFGTGGLLNAASYLAHENLPVSSLGKLAQGEMPDLGDVSADALGALTHARTVAAGGSHLPGVLATVETGVNMTRAHVTVGEYFSTQHVANTHDAELTTRPFGPDRIAEGAGKPSTLSAKTVNAETAPFYPEVPRGGFAAGPPELPANATPQQRAVYERLNSEYQVKTEPAVATLVEQGYTREHGQLFDPTGRPVTSDPDMLSFKHPDGTPMTAQEAKAVTDALRANPYTNVQHGQASGPGGYVDYVTEHGGSPAQIAEAARLVSEWEARGPGAVWRPQQLGPAGSLLPAPAEPVAPSGAVPPTARADYRDVVADFYKTKTVTP